MMLQKSGKKVNLEALRHALFSLLKPERSFFGVVVAYSVAIGLLTLAVPIAVQTLINTLVNIASTRAVITLAVILFGTLVLSGCFAALRMRVMEYYERRVYSRLVAELSLRTILAPHSYFEGRKNTSMTHRYFDIMTLQKNVPSLMVDGIALVLQMLVGFTLVAFYHPFLLAFNICVLVIMYLIWRLWSTNAKLTAVSLSEAKYSTAKWLSSLASAHEYVKSATQFDYAGKKTEKYIAEYTHCHQRHFVFTFRQVVMFLLLYALASAALLGLGGILVIGGQLSVGQLVAAELIMSAVFLGISRFSYYLKLYYELYGTADKLGGVFAMPQESLEHSSKPEPQNGGVVFHHVVTDYCNECCDIHFSLDHGAKAFITTTSNWTQRQVINLLKRYSAPANGWVSLGGYDVTDLDTYALRQAEFVLDRSLIVECTIAEYFKMTSPSVTEGQIKQVLEKVGLNARVHHLPDGLDTAISSTGVPLQPLEFILLKLAAAMLSTPKVLIMNQHFDTVPDKKRQSLLSLISEMDSTVIYFSNMPDLNLFKNTIHLESRNASELGQRGKGAMTQ